MSVLCHFRFKDRNRSRNALSRLNAAQMNTATAHITQIKDDTVISAGYLALSVTGDSGLADIRRPNSLVYALVQRDNPNSGKVRLLSPFHSQQPLCRGPLAQPARFRTGYAQGGPNFANGHALPKQARRLLQNRGAQRIAGPE
jgi:hypothetical protein